MPHSYTQSEQNQEPRMAQSVSTNFKVSPSWTASADMAKTLSVRASGSWTPQDLDSIPLEEFVFLETSVFLRGTDESSSCDVSIAPPLEKVLRGIAIVSEASRVEVFGNHEEYEGTWSGRLVEDVEDTMVFRVDVFPRGGLREAKLKLHGKKRKERSLWVYGILLLVLDAAPVAADRARKATVGCPDAVESLLRTLRVSDPPRGGDAVAALSAYVDARLGETERRLEALVDRRFAELERSVRGMLEEVEGRLGRGRAVGVLDGSGPSLSHGEDE
ncbi:unnamed protein product [Darwinula stevensoni]|uniref:Uncharacterized protein n=1 Tax=Darwinula stevensoni TaxID=69355 RepID=A0A7R9FQU5_9CRUS|nr:unnamed protein product [Darwinula stevensoni]CAG0900186.1 unnamed protein product [Darwinula stevensoni]